jgi:MFS family permease
VKEPEDIVKEKGERQTILIIFKTVASELKNNRGLFELLVIESFIAGVNATYYFFYQSQIGTLLGWKISAIMLVSTAIQAFCSWLSVKIGEKNSPMVVFPIVTLLIGLLLVVTFFRKSWIYLVTYLLTNGLYAILVPIFSNYFNQMIPSNVRATFISVSSMMFSLAMIVCFPLAGFFIEKNWLCADFWCTGYTDDTFIWCD